MTCVSEYSPAMEFTFVLLLFARTTTVVEFPPSSKACLHNVNIINFNRDLHSKWAIRGLHFGSMTLNTTHVRGKGG